MKFENLWSFLTLLILFFSTVLFGYLKSVDQANSRENLTWRFSQWVGPEVQGPNGYFRYQFNVEDGVQRAVLQVAGTDTLTTYVNGKSLESITSKSMSAAAVYDLSNKLSAGSNVLAFEVHKASHPASVGLRFELKIIDKLGKTHLFVSGEDVKAQSLYQHTSTRAQWFSPNFDDAYWPNANSAQGYDSIVQVGMAPNSVLALPVPTAYVVGASNHWTVSLTHSFDYKQESDNRVWLAFSSEVPFETIINGISLGVYPNTENGLHLNSILPKLREGENSIEFVLMTSGVSPVVGGGIIFEDDGQVTTLFVNPEWQLVGGSKNTRQVLVDVNALEQVGSVTLATPAFPPVFNYVIENQFVKPALAQSGPWLYGLLVLVFVCLCAPLFRVFGLSLDRQLRVTALANSLAVLCLLAAWFVAQDVRFDARQIFSGDALLLVLITWMLLVIAVLAEQCLTFKSPTILHSDVKPSSSTLSNGVFVLLTVIIAMVAFFLRLQNIEQNPLTVDEATIAGFARGVLERGYPYLMVGGMEVELATYELVPYFLAASIKVFGYSDFGLRVPALLFGVCTCLLIIYCGSKWFGRLAGLVAGMLFAISPWAIYWGQNCFHPSQIQFFNLLALVAFYRLLISDHISIKLAFLSAVAFACSYLSWEGSGLVLPIMAFVAIVMRWKQWKWFFQPNLWIAAVLIIFVVAAQGIRRTLLQEPFIMVGFGKSDTMAPKLTFTDASYEPLYYINNFFFIETHIGLSLFFILGLVFMFYDRKLSFVILFVVMAYLSLTNLLGFYNAHYFYFVLPVFLLAVAAVFVKVLMLTLRSTNLAPGVIHKSQGLLVAIFASLILFLPASAGTLKFYKLMNTSIDAMRVDYRPGLAGMNGRDVSTVLSQYWRQGDALITSIPLLTEHYANNKGHYFVQTITDRKVVYDTVERHPYYVDKFVGNPVLRTKQELQDVLRTHERVFFVAAPVDGLTRIIDEDTLNFINQNMRVVAESYDSRLYVWER